MRARWAGLGPWLAVAAAICVLDQLTKMVASNHLVYGVPRAVMPCFNWTLLHNTGAAFSLLNDAAGWQRWLFSSIAVVVGSVVVWRLATMERSERLEATALAFILGGAIGNLIDRLRFGYVVDFIHVYFRQYSFPAFNIADSAIVVGAFLMLLAGTLSAPRPRAAD